MSADDNIKAIQLVYEAFGRGDVAAILDTVTEDVEWGTETSSTAAPWWGIRHGRDGVAAFFQDFASTMAVDEFTPLSFAANGSDVFSTVRLRTHSLATGKTAAMDLHHWFVFRDGRICRYRGTEDTVQTVEVLQA